MRSVTDFRFGVSLGGWSDGPALLAAARTAESAGFDVVTVADHLGHPAPFSALAAAAAVTTRVRLRTYVLDSYFWNPALLAREAATLDLLSGGRLELGVGAGHMRHEHVDAGLPFPAVAKRWAHTAAVIADVRRRLADDDHVPARGDGSGASTPGRAGRLRSPVPSLRTVQRPVPLMVAAMGEAGLRVAAEHADVVGLAGAFQVRGRRAGVLTLADAATTDERVALVREVAATHGRTPELDVLLQQVVVDTDPEKAATEAAREATGHGMDWFTPALLLESPFVLFAATPEDAAAELVGRAQRWGVRSWSTHAPWGPALSQVATAVRTAHSPHSLAALGRQ
jgi:probable F420-dependent oxidoreductase